ncbi:pantetheine-phosphate adenylyltransferase [Sphaerobacter sp.]|uniref:Phosphopantetheine adenylyltransferase n=1 Tax=uncultured organism TaxID=155900 RepID=A0A0G2YFY4_9ZZZZ|nr:pantetheine-phosphate adenylyltransferase [Sphaerobacter sp.]AKI85292.1 Phosphopantetheine adenylyltransferase [uncultured organism]MBX5446228.1 pantetheine-phosphate adenylyltransferase [Sphaerobacter sp.]
MTHIALYPGSFDPITNGHIDVACRAARLFDKLIVAIYEGDELHDKRALFSVEERRAMAEQALAGLAPNLRVDTYRGLTVDYARSVGAQVIVRGLRAVSDFEYEFKLAHMNRHMAPDVDVVCLMTSSQHSFVSSSLIKQVASLGGNVQGLVPDHVAEALARKFGAVVRE